MSNATLHPGTAPSRTTSTTSSDFEWSDDEDYNDETKPMKYDLEYETRKRYTKICESLRVPVISMFIENLTSSNLMLGHRGVGSKALHGITLSLRHNHWVTSLDLTDNNLDKNAAGSIARMFEDNNFIHRVNLSCNHIGSEGLQCLLKSLQFKSSVTHLDISSNRLPDKIADSLQAFLTINRSLLELNLSKNELSTECGLKLREGIANNKSLKILDISWNQIRSESAVEIAKGLAENTSLTHVNFAWNGFANSGADALGRALHVNRTLKYVDLSYNRIEDKGLRTMGEALCVNTALEILRLGWNPIKRNGVNSLVQGCLQNHKYKLKALHLESIYLDDDNLIHINKLIAKVPSFIITHAGYCRENKFNESIEELRRQLLNILRTYLIDNRLRMVDLFNQWDKDKSHSITREEFRNGVQQCRIPFTEPQLNILIEWLDDDQSDSIEYSEFVGITEIE